jgi:hypothetical protein
MTIDLNQTDTPASACVNCGKIVDAATGAGKPKPGAFSLCYYCGHLSVFGDDMLLRQPTSAEMDLIAGDETLVLYSKLIAELRMVGAVK